MFQQVIAIISGSQLPQKLLKQSELWLCMQCIHNQRNNIFYNYTIVIGC
jgi:hypothetical protein